jgi:hypothetical protein
MRNKKTAVDYLINQISDIIGRIKPNVLDTLLFITALEEAKKIEEKQIKDAWIDGFKSSAEGWNGEMLPDYKDGKQIIDEHKEEYFKENYGK